MNKLSVTLALIGSASCAPATDPAPAAATEVSLAGSDPQRHGEPGSDAPGGHDLNGAERRRSRELSGIPVWTVESATDDPSACFGVAVAAGDLDGDGHRDVIVAEGVCQFTFDTAVQGRIAIYRGGPSLPSTTAVFTELAWQNPPEGADQMTLAVGDVDGDRRDDLLVSSTAGVLVFSRITNLAAPLGAPAFRIPATGRFGPAALADVNGDRRADIVSIRQRVATVWLATPGAPGGPFTAARAVSPVTDVLAPGDSNRDGKEDVVLTNRVDSQLLLGCRARERDCDGGLRAAPAWTTTAQPVRGLVPDINRDGLAEAILTDTGFGNGPGLGRVWLHLSDRATGLSAAPAWATLGDSRYNAFGLDVLVPGDLDGDHRSNEFVITSNGRMYAFFPPRSELATMQPGFAWPRNDSTQVQLEAGEAVFTRAIFAAAGDVDSDRFDDLLAGDPRLFGETRPDRVHLMAGGRQPRSEDPPFLPGAHVCNLPDAGKADITVDAQALERSLFVANLTFAPDACEVVDGCVGAPGERRLLRFATSIANFGGGAAIIPDPDTAPELYRFNTCVGVPELVDFSQYELLDPTGGRTALGRKQSVFLVDVAPNCIDAGPSTLPFPNQTLSPGWGDVYVTEVPCNWLDITGVPDGRYTLRVSVDTNRIVDQDNVLPDSAEVEIELAGDRVTVLR
jgi:Lysyl oxidase/FG-GAP-like repeat